MGERRYSKQEQALEVKSLRRIISAYLNYPDAAEEDIRRYERTFRKLPPAHKVLLAHLPLKYQRLRQCVSVNTFFIMNMLQAFEPPLDMSHGIDVDGQESLESIPHGTLQSHNSEVRSISVEQPVSITGIDYSGPDLSSTNGETNIVCCNPRTSNGKEEILMESSCECIMDRSLQCDHHTLCIGGQDNVKAVADSGLVLHHPTANGNVASPTHDWLDPAFQLNVPLVDVDKVRCIIRNIVRDWAPEGQEERDQCYKPILEELDRLFPDRSKESPPCCLIPGAGLGRLALEISCLGFISQGNEFSYYMMICSSFILNHTEIAGEWSIYPWIHSNCNSLSDNDQLRPISFPDIHPASAGITEGFSMCGGDFVEVYNDESHEASWDAVVTCFFLDTAHNIVEYIDIISRILIDGGVWINFGPLLYHFADAYGSEDEMSVELSLEEVKRVAFHFGFELVREEIIETTYTTNPRSMMQNHYFAAFWTMKKKSKA